jgi:hypothetical protein
LVKKRRKNEEKNEEDPHSGWDGRLRGQSDLVLEKRSKNEKNKEEKSFSHSLEVLIEHRHLLTSFPLDLAFSAIINTTTTDSQSTYASRVRTFKLLDALRPRLKVRVTICVHDREEESFFFSDRKCSQK